MLAVMADRRRRDPSDRPEVIAASLRLLAEAPVRIEHATAGVERSAAPADR